MAFGDRLFHALTEAQIRQHAKPHLRGIWLDQLYAIRDLPETKGEQR